MNNEFYQLAKRLVPLTMRWHTAKQFGCALAGIALTCFGPTQTAHAQTTIICDTAGDAIFSSGKGGPAVPPWLDIIQTAVATDLSGTLFFTMTMNAPVPATPAWSGVDDGGQLWWGWRMVDDLATDTILKKDGCIKAQGSSIPAGYFLDLIWEVTSSSFHARLLDDTTCAQNAVAFYFSTDRTQITLVLPQSLLTNTNLIPDQNNFQFFAGTLVWKANSTGNNSFFTVDLVPDGTSSGLAVATWSATSNANYFCQ